MKYKEALQILKDKETEITRRSRAALYPIQVMISDIETTLLVHGFGEKETTPEESKRVSQLLKISL